MTSAVAVETRFMLSDGDAREVAAKHGTPIYVIDETHLRTRIREFVDSANLAYPGAKVAFASKANSTFAVLAMAFSEGCAIDVASEGELRAALGAGVPAAACHVHGNNKSLAELAFAIGSGVSQIVIDHFGEIEMIGSLLKDNDGPEVMLRLAPGVDPETHEKISTGQADTKFGFSVSDGSARLALKLALDAGLRVAGFHCHVGSQLMDSQAQESAADIFGQFCQQMRQEFGYWPTRINIGGGLGVRYTDDQHPISISEYCRRISKAISHAGLDGVELIHEPGRSLVAESGITLYRVGVVKHLQLLDSQKIYVAVDGGLADNPRPALYGARYTVLPASADGRKLSSDQMVVTISGRHCETDRLFADVVLPADLRKDDLLQVLCTGAYSSSMASNYNRYPRPATVLRRQDGSFSIVQRPESYDQLFSREVNPRDLGLLN